MLALFLQLFQFPPRKFQKLGRRLGRIGRLAINIKHGLQLRDGLFWHGAGQADGFDVVALDRGHGFPTSYLPRQSLHAALEVQ